MVPENGLYVHRIGIGTGKQEQASLKAEAIFLISPELIRWYKANPDLTLFGYTFKPNRYCRPLLNICGVSGENKTIQAGIAMIGGQAQEWYQ